MSAALCSAALLREAPMSGTEPAAEQPVPAASQENMTLTGSNSLSRYLAKQGTEQAANTPPAAQPLAASAADAVFAVTDLDFDRETGVIRVTSTQSEAVTLRVSFIDEDHPANVYTVDYGTAAGEYVHSVFSADISRLPEYFTVQAQIVGRAGLPLCRAFELKTYHREMQEIIRTEVSDFAPEQVVNLDGDGTTNFLVLSEDTVRAETTADSNILVSADYDRNIYVFDHIDDSIRSLEQGQYFYIQPTGDDIISTDVREIVIDGDTATITGTGEIDDMFDFIKIESESEQTVEGAYHGTQYYGVNAQVITDENELDQRLKAVDPDAEPEEISVNNSVSVEMKGFREHIKVTPSLNYQVKTKWNVYKRFHYLNLFLVTETKVTFNLKATATTDGEDPKEEGTETNDHWHQLPIYSCGAADVSLILDLDLELSGEFELEVGLQFTKGFVFDSDDGLEWIIFDTEPFFSKLELQGELSVEFKAGIELKALKGLLKASVTGGIQGTATVGSDTDSDPRYNQTGKMVFMPEPAVTADTVHYDERCRRIRLEVKLIIEAKVSAGFDIKDSKNALAKLANLLGADKLKYSKTFKKEIESVFGHRLPAYDIYCSYNSAGDHRGLHFSLQKVQADGTSHCPHNAYRVTFHVGFVNAPYGTKASLITDGSVFPLTVSPDGTLILYAEPRTDSQSYEYLIMVNGEQKISGKTFTVTNAPLEISHTIEWPAVETGTALPVADGGNIQTGKAVTTVTEPVITTEPPVFDYTDQIPSPEKISKKADNYDLGENISGQFNNDGSFLVYGYGDMYENPVIPAEVRAGIREVVFMDHEPENGLYINDIGNGLFSGAKNLKYVYMPARITAIGNSAFSGCESLQYLRYGGEDDVSETFVLPDTLKSVGAYAFSGCSAAAFGALAMPESIRTIGENAFEGCAGMTAVTVPGSSKPEIGKYAFRGCSNLKTAVLGTGIQSIGLFVFSNCGSLGEVTLPYLGLNAEDTANQVYAFFDVDDQSAKPHPGMKLAYQVLTSGFNQWYSYYYLPEKLQKLTFTGGNAVPDSFFHHFAAGTVVLPAGIQTIGSNAFLAAESLTVLQFGSGGNSEQTVLPDGLISVGQSAFSGCSALPFGALTMPESIRTIGDNAFEGCAGMTAVTVPENSSPEIGTLAFRGCSNLKTAVLGTGIQSLGLFVFSNCGSLEEVTLPYFGLNAEDTANQVYAFFDADDQSEKPHPGMKLVDTVLTSGFNQWHSYYYLPEKLQKLTVSGGEAVPDSFFHHYAAGTLVLPAGIKTIGSSAFIACENLTVLQFGSGDAPAYTVLPEYLESVGNSAFSGCKSLPFGALSVPERVGFIGEDAFCGCEGITELNIPGSGMTVSKQAFRNCVNLRKAVLADGIAEIGLHLFSGCCNMEEITVPYFGLSRDDTAHLMYAFFDEDIDYDRAHPGMKLCYKYLTSGFNGTHNYHYFPEKLKKVTVTGGETVPAGFFRFNQTDPTLESVTFSGSLKTVREYAFDCCESLKEAKLTGTGAKWSKVEIIETGNDPLLRLVRKNRPEGYHPGDLNGDDRIDVSDAVLLARFAAEDVSAKITDLGVLNADVNGDGNADINDVVLILQYIARKITVFPVDE